VALILFFAIPLFLVFIGLEMVLSRRRGLALYAARDTAANLTMGLGNVVVKTLWKATALALLFAVYELRLFDVPVDALWAWLALLIAEDFCYYWFHRVHHECRLGWAAHVNHHSSERYNLAVALRQSWTSPFTGLVFWLPLALLGFHPLMIATHQAISLIYQFWIHTQTFGRLGPLEWVLNTPSHHRVHHGTNPQYIDRNYGGILIVWDRLFGTFEAEGEPVRYGITHQLNTFNPLRIAFHEWAAMLRDVWRATGTRQRLGYLLRHPGWTPNGQTTSSSR
jgi:sterol desaturase/sphingolipid hydroxylase (fatty acid hydroxylase superfamily)